MSSITSLYTSLAQQLRQIEERYTAELDQAEQSRVQDERMQQRRIENLRLQLEKMEEYSAKVEYFRKLAEKHIQSKNLLTIIPRELNFNRLRNWAMNIDPTDRDDPYAQRVYVQACCNELFLRNKRREFEQTLEQLTAARPETEPEEEQARKRATLARRDEEVRGLLEGEEFSAFAALLADANAARQGFALPPREQARPEEKRRPALGVYAQWLAVPEGLRPLAKVRLEDGYDVASGCVLLPADHAPERETVVAVRCCAGKQKKLYRGIRRYLLDLLAAEPLGERRLVFVDALHFNNSVLGELRPLEGTPLLDPVPRDADQALDLLKQMVASFSETDEALGMADSVEEFNAQAAPEARIRRRVLVLLGYPSAFSAQARDLIRRILINHEHYGISLLLADTQYTEKREEEAVIPLELAEQVYTVTMTPKRETIRLNTGSDHPFRWYELRQTLPPSLVNDARAQAARSAGLGTEYVKRVDMEQPPAYQRGNRSIVLPYGVDAADHVNSLCFDNENFAAYLMGASGSGKSTMLHTLITGILRNYHPDDVELWLADFKMSEFAQYLDPMPPHVKYVLLDESRELVYDLLDRLTDTMMERQRFFMKHREMKKVENVPSSVYMPVIFVILDEFSIMSQAVEESETYKLKLQNLLAKGRALGIKFLFSSQTFIKGVSGLTRTAKDQIQMRIAMKNSADEIRETLELPRSASSEQVRGWIEALPPHYTLTKYRDGEAVRVQRNQVMYFKGSGEAAMEPQRRLIRQICDAMRPVEEYAPERPETYVNKHPVVVDGNSFAALREEETGRMLRDFAARHRDDVGEEDLVFTFGTPRRMESVHFGVMSGESRENLLVIARAAEQPCAMSLLLSAMKCARLQDAAVQVWAYPKNRLFRAYRDGQFDQWNTAQGPEEVCARIAALREKIEQRRPGRELIVMVGMDQLCTDFEFLEPARSPQKAGTQPEYQVKMEFKDEAERAAAWYNVQFNRLLHEEYDLDQKEMDWLEEGLSIEQIGEEEEKLIEELQQRVAAGEFSDRFTPPPEEEAPETTEPEPPEEEAPAEEPFTAYDAREDLKYILRQGSRLGYHFLLLLNNCTDLRATGLQYELFRHKLTFQLSMDDSYQVLGNKSATRLPAHICLYSDSMEQYSLRPYLHPGVVWESWDVDENGSAVNTALL